MRALPGLFLALSLGGCEGPTNARGDAPLLSVTYLGRSSVVDVFHDNSRAVTCWEVYRGLACLPDAVLRDGGVP